MFKFIRCPAISRPLAGMLIFSVLILQNGCSYFKVTSSADSPRRSINQMQDANKFIILHLDDKAWQFTEITITDETVDGTIRELMGHDRYRTVKTGVANRYDRKDESEVLNEAHIFVDGFTETIPGKISISASDIRKIELYDKDSGATAASYIFTTLGISAGILAFVGVIVALTKSSCPFVYINNGDGYTLIGEIFSGAVQPGLQREDFLKLPGIVSADNVFRLKLTNEVHEIQYVDLASLIVIDHPGNTSVLIDKYGKAQTYSEPVVPVSAISRMGNDLLPLLEKKDSLNYYGDPKDPGRDGVEEMVMKFVRPAGSQTGKLIIRAKNSFWLDVLFTRFHGLFGGRYDQFAEKQGSIPGNKLNEYLLDQKIPLSVSIEKNNQWQPSDYFNIAGPVALRDDVLNLDLSGAGNDTVKIKLETGFLFWEIDYVAMDFSPEQNLNVSEIQAAAASGNKVADAGKLLLSGDKNYLVLDEVGDEVNIEFEEPAKKDAERSVFLHTSGYYKILRNQEGMADRKTLKTFRKQNRFPEFSKETYDNLPITLKQ